MAKKKTSKKKTSSSIYDEFEETSTEVLKGLQEEEEELKPSGKSSDFLSLDDGENKFRIYPKRKGVDKAFYRMMSSWWLPFKKKDGTFSRTKINNSIVHSGTDNDIVEEYVNVATRILNSGDEEDNTKLEKITDWRNGIGSQISFVIYAEKILSKTKKEFGLLDMNVHLKDLLMKECIIEDEDEAIEVDPYTSPKKGHPVIVTYDKSEKGAKRYSIRLSKFTAPLTVEDLKKFKNLPPLAEHPLFNYTIKDFERALECLEIFDEEYEIGVFDSPEFKKLIKQVKKQLSKKKTSKGDNDEDEDDEEDVEDQYDDDVVDDDDDEEDTEDEEEDTEDEDEDDDEEDEDNEEDDDEEPWEDDEDDEDEEEEEEKPKRKKKSEVSLDDIKKKLQKNKKKKK